MRWVGWIVALVCGGGAAAFAMFLSALPNGDDTAPIVVGEGIVVPTGGTDRIATGLDLLEAGGARLLITGVYRDTELPALLAETGRDAPACCVDIDHTAGNTAANADAARVWADRHRLTRLRLVTSWYHMPRSRLLFERAMPNLEIVPHPVLPAQAYHQRWWQFLGGWRLVVGEFAKYCLAFVGAGGAAWS